MRFSRNAGLPMSKNVFDSTGLAILTRPEQRRRIRRDIQREREPPADARGENPDQMHAGIASGPSTRNAPAASTSA